MNDKKKTILDLKNIIPELTTKNLTFRLMNNSDLYCLFNSSQNEEFNKNLGWGPPKNQEELINIFYDKNKDDKAAIFSVSDKNKGNWLGIIKYEIFKDEVSIAIWVHYDYWKIGISYEMACVAVQSFFTYTNEKEIIAIIKKDNNLMKKYVESNNFKYTRDDTFFHITKQEDFDCWIYKAKKEDWDFKFKISKIKE